MALMESRGGPPFPAHQTRTRPADFRYPAFRLASLQGSRCGISSRDQGRRNRRRLGAGSSQRLLDLVGIVRLDAAGKIGSLPLRKALAILADHVPLPEGIARDDEGVRHGLSDPPVTP